MRSRNIMDPIAGNRKDLKALTRLLQYALKPSPGIVQRVVFSIRPRIAPVGAALGNHLRPVSPGTGHELRGDVWHQRDRLGV
jgi:hypothetical protein